MKNILNVSCDKALIFFLNQANYFNLDLPPYFDFQKIIDKTYSRIKNKQLSDVCNKNSKNRPDYPKNYEGVNYKLINNKNGKYDWRPFEIIHPVLYVDLVQQICNEDNWNIIKKRFKEFSNNKKIVCCSIPLYYSNKKNIILNWWSKFEQKSISNSLKYKYMACTDIINCYSSLYTHSISWAIHTKEVSKKERDEKMLGNIIDQKLQNMNYGQTNGIPQGSILMDLIAEIVLGYADELLSSKLEEANVDNYQILRYRDDYKIFADDLTTIEKILKMLTEVLGELNLKLNSNKTYITDDIVNGSIKKDKIYRLQNPINKSLNKQKKLLLIYNFSLEYPNSGSLKVLLTNLYREEFLNSNRRPNSYEQIISIIIEIMFRNQSTYGICIGIISEIFKFLNKRVREKYVDLILKKFNNTPNSSYLEISLQRITLIDNRSKEYNSLICQKLYTKNKIWNSDWLNFELDESFIIDENIIKDLTINISEEEADKFSVSHYNN